MKMIVFIIAALVLTVNNLNIQVIIPDSPLITPQESNDLRNIRLSINSQKSLI
jgi:hypothetical protein